VAQQELHQRRLRSDPVPSRGKRCRSLKDRSCLEKVGVRDRVREICYALHNSGSLLWDSGVLSSNVVPEVQCLFKAIEKQRL
jgi:hypothetical protein